MKSTPDPSPRSAPQRSCCLIYLSDVHVGTVAKAIGTPNAMTQWKWSCGFYPGSAPGEQTNGTADTVRSGPRRLREGIDHDEMRKKASGISRNRRTASVIFDAP
jgi:hypothetical protein